VVRAWHVQRIGSGGFFYVGAPRLREVHVCFDRELDPRACSADALREACRASSVIVPPIR
jgi:ribonuclease I